ncbi:ACT domain-containing protein DS12 [Hibiscus syriacus]|uniref:tRNA (guanine(9)-N(1))-methyltransferase n=2 Tax=Hibiscus syriacus TaxID=106335 RepID=A0A6A3D6N7_HIBSY|nr:ACT domain-containing protein DS12 [Hibiscus syriacus]
MNALKSLRLNVTKANVYLDSSGKHNKFSITKASTGRKVEEPELLEAIRLTIINNLLQYHPESSSQLAMGATFGVEPPKETVDVDIATHVRVRDDGPDRSLLFVKTADRPGLLVDLVKAITDINIAVESGEFDTEGLLAKAMFHVNYNGKALIKPLQQEITCTQLSPAHKQNPKGEGKQEKSNSPRMYSTMEATLNEQNSEANPPDFQPQTLSKNAQKKLLRQQKNEAKKAEKKAQMKEQKQRDAERKRKEWEEKLAALSEDERVELIDSRKESRKERMEKETEERGQKIQRLTQAKETGQNIVVDLEFSHLMTHSEIHSLVQQITYCYGVNGRCNLPAHLWLTGVQGEMETQLQLLPGFDKWIIEKERQSYIEGFSERKDDLVYLTADSGTVLHELDPAKVYIVGGLVDRNRWKGITLKKAKEQGIRTAKLPIRDYMKMSSSQVLTVNQVIEILLKFLETKDWKASFFRVVPQRRKTEGDSGNCQQADGEEFEEIKEYETKKRCLEVLSHD